MGPSAVCNCACSALACSLQGEVLIRSPSNFTGYYKAQAMTDEVRCRGGVGG